MKGIPVTPDGHPARVTRVITGDYRQFVNWCRYSRVNPRSPNVKFVCDEYDLRGLSDFDIVFTGTVRASREVRVLETVRRLRAAGKIGREYFQHESADIEPNVVDPVP